MRSLEEHLKRADDAALALSIDDAMLRLPDHQAAFYLGYLADHVGAETLGDLLEHPEANRLHGHALRPRERDNVDEVLAHFVARPSDVVWRWKPRSSVRVEPPPDHRGGLQKWARREELDDALAAPVSHLLPWLPARLANAVRSGAPSRPIGKLLESGLRGGEARFAGDAFAAVRHYMHFAALRRAQAERREALWEKRPAQPAMRQLAARLHELRRNLDESSADLPARLGGEERVCVDVEPPAIHCAFGGERDEALVRIELDGYEVSPLNATIEGGVHESDPMRSPQLRALAEWSLDAVHDPTHPLNEAIRRAVGQPSWARLVESLAEQVEAPADEEVQERVAWRLDPETLELAPAVQRLGRSGKWTRGAMTKLDELAQRPEILDGHDQVVLDRLLAAEALLRGRKASEHRVAERRARALFALVGHPRVTTRDARTIVRVVRATPRVVIRQDGAAVLAETLLGEQPLRFEVQPVGAQTVARFDAEEGTLHVARVEERAARMIHTLTTLPARVPAEGEQPFVTALLRAQPGIELQLPAALRGEAQPPETTPIARLDALDDGLRIRLCARPVPNGGIWPAGDGPRLVVGLDGGRRVHAVRDLNAERERAEVLRDSLGALVPDGGGHRVVGLESALGVVEKLQLRAEAGEVELQWRSGSWRVGRSVGASDLRVRVRSAGAWFGVDGEAEVDGAKIPLKALLTAARDGSRYVKIGPGRFARIGDDLRKRLSEAADLLHEDDGEVQAGVAAAPALKSLVDSLEGDGRWLEVVRAAEEAPEMAPELPEMNAELRPYQKDGFVWLARLASWGAGAVLADEMGLGKTVQALAMLARRGGDGPALVVAPTSVTPGWIDEATRFTPSLNPIAYRGQNRAPLREGLGPNDILVTSYDIAARDADDLADIGFATLVLDEAQAIKNARTKRAKAVAKLDAGWRVALTGTPLENHLGELWSILRVVSPGFLGPWERFRRTYALPIERDGDVAKRTALAERLRPFVLRRTKAQVAPELPPRTEVVRPVELGEGERQIYDAARREALEGLVGAKRFDVLAAITRLRLLSCHPRLVDARSTTPSAKMEAALELMDELREEGHRALVFSQFTRHLGLVREALDLRGLRHLYLDGSTPTKRRATLVKEWNEGDAPYFLISLKAGGTGLNLTGADYVLHLDPWWNPAVEDQASDRAHRIGQTKPVTVVRLVSQGTIEESVLSLHAAKRELAAAVLEGGAAAAKLSTDELVALIRGE